MDFAYTQNVATKAAYNSAKILCGHFGHLDRIDKKGPMDLVTAADIESENQIIETIHARFPDHAILAEESGNLNNSSTDCLWIIDPLDGTTNFAHQLPMFSISIAFCAFGEISVGVVLNPVTGEFFSAIKGQGARLNGNAIAVSDQKQLSESLLVTGFPYDFKKNVAPFMARFQSCLTASIGVRRLGSAALDLCWVACGRFDGFWEEHLKPWDTAAGMLIVQEAGGEVSDFSGTPYSVEKPEILATNGHIHKELRQVLNSAV